MAKTANVRTLTKWFKDNVNVKGAMLQGKIGDLELKRSVIEKYKGENEGLMTDWVKAQIADALKNEKLFPKLKAGKAREEFKEEDVEGTVTHVGNCMVGGLPEALKMKELKKAEMKRKMKDGSEKTFMVPEYSNVTIRYAGGMVLIFKNEDKAKADKLIPAPTPASK